MTHPFLKSLPNTLTISRVLLIPIFVFLMINPSKGELIAATVIFIIAALTDYLDGVLARRWGVVSDFGKLLDPLADKILVMAALVMLVEQRGLESGDPWVPGWMVILVLAREFWVMGVRSVAAVRGEVMAASIWGKVKSLLQMVSISLLLLYDLFYITVADVEIPIGLVGINLLFFSIFLSYVGAVEYTFNTFTRTKRDKRDPYA